MQVASPPRMSPNSLWWVVEPTLPVRWELSTHPNWKLMMRTQNANENRRLIALCQWEWGLSPSFNQELEESPQSRWEEWGGHLIVWGLHQHQVLQSILVDIVWMACMVKSFVGFWFCKQYCWSGSMILGHWIQRGGCRMQVGCCGLLLWECWHYWCRIGLE